MEGTVSYRPEAGFAWCSVSWYPAVAKGVGTRAEATDAMDGVAEMIRKQNIKLFQDSVKVCQNFENEGFANCILKGQGNALLYPDHYMRTPGDIDIYLAGGRKRVMQYIK